MKRFILAGLGLCVLAGAGLYYSGSIQKLFPGSVTPGEAQAQAATPGQPSRPRRPPASVLTSPAEEKIVDVRLDAIGTAQAIASVTLRARIDSVITAVHVKDGAIVKVGDPLFTLDDRQIKALIRQAEAQLARNKASLEGAQRDVVRLTELLARDATSRKQLDDARTAFAVLEGQIKADEAQVENLKVQATFTEIRSPIAGRFGAAPLKVGNVVRLAEATSVLGTILQTSPVYVAFGVPQRLFLDLREARDNGTAKVKVMMPGAKEAQIGTLAVLDNTIDTTTGMIMIRAELPNADETVWPGAIVNVRLVLREEKKIVVPAQAVQTGQKGTFVFINDNGVARVRPVEVNRTQDGLAIINSGLKAQEQVITEGQLVILDGSPIVVRNRAAS